MQVINTITAKASSAHSWESALQVAYAMSEKLHFLVLKFERLSTPRQNTAHTHFGIND